VLFRAKASTTVPLQRFISIKTLNILTSLSTISLGFFYFKAVAEIVVLSAKIFELYFSPDVYTGNVLYHPKSFISEKKSKQQLRKE
jgi:hypothetical protein